MPPDDHSPRPQPDLPAAKIGRTSGGDGSAVEGGDSLKYYGYLHNILILITIYYSTKPLFSIEQLTEVYFMDLKYLDQFTGKLAIGSLLASALVLFIHIFVDLKPFIEWFGSTKIWELFVAIPIIILSYLLGVITFKLSSNMFDVYRGDNIENRIQRIIRISKTRSDYIIKRYEKAHQELELLQAACVAAGFFGLVVLIKSITASSAIERTLTYARFIFGSLAAIIIMTIPLLLYLISKTYIELIEMENQVSSEVTKKEYVVSS